MYTHLLILTYNIHYNSDYIYVYIQVNNNFKLFYTHFLNSDNSTTYLSALHGGASYQLLHGEHRRCMIY